MTRSLLSWFSIILVGCWACYAMQGDFPGGRGAAQPRFVGLGGVAWTLRAVPQFGEVAFPADADADAVVLRLVKPQTRASEVVVRVSRSMSPVKVKALRDMYVVVPDPLSKYEASQIESGRGFPEEMWPPSGPAPRAVAPRDAEEAMRELARLRWIKLPTSGVLALLPADADSQAALQSLMDPAVLRDRLVVRVPRDTPTDRLASLGPNFLAIPCPLTDAEARQLFGGRD